MLHYLFVILAGLVLTDLSGYWWHRLVAHKGVFSFLPNDYLRQRHHDHHYDKYPLSRLITAEYLQSCDIVFHALAVFIALPMLIITALGWITFVDLVIFFVAAGLYALLVIGAMHNAYHLQRSTLQRNPIMRNKVVWNVFRWLRAYHSIHHKLNANYSILLPIDILFGTYVSPKRGARHAREELFPGFNTVNSRGCTTDL